MGVSILYEVPRVCNGTYGGSGNTTRMFQSSTRFLEFATTYNLQMPALYQVSILYEVPRVCNVGLAFAARQHQSFNPLRGSSSLQRKIAPRSGRQTGGFNPLRGSSSLQPIQGSTVRRLKVSILYEVPRVCNRPQLHRGGRDQRVSILYEVPRVCNGMDEKKYTINGGFNPLRGSSSLQHYYRSRRFTFFVVSILYEVPRVCNIGPLAWVYAYVAVSILYEVPRVCNSGEPSTGETELRFQSSTRFLEFATWEKLYPNYPIAVSILYEVPRVCNRRNVHSVSSNVRFQSSTRFLEFATG